MSPEFALQDEEEDDIPVIEIVETLKKKNSLQKSNSEQEREEMQSDISRSETSSNDNYVDSYQSLEEEEDESLSSSDEGATSGTAEEAAGEGYLKIGTFLPDPDLISSEAVTADSTQEESESSKDSSMSEDDSSSESFNVIKKPTDPPVNDPIAKAAPTKKLLEPFAETSSEESDSSSENQSSEEELDTKKKTCCEIM